MYLENPIAFIVFMPMIHIFIIVWAWANPMAPINWFAHFICEQKFLIWGSQSGKTISEVESHGVQMGHSLDHWKALEM